MCIKIFKKSIMIVFTIVLLFSAISFSEERPGPLKSVTGNVVEADWVGSLLIVDCGEQMTFFVPTQTRVMHEADEASFADIEQGDPVDIQYYEDSHGTLKTVGIQIRKAYPAFN